MISGISATFIFLIWRRFVCRSLAGVTFVLMAFLTHLRLRVTFAFLVMHFPSHVLHKLHNRKIEKSKCYLTLPQCLKMVKNPKNRLLLLWCERSQFYLQEEKVMKNSWKFRPVQATQTTFILTTFRECKTLDCDIGNGKYIFLWYFLSNFRTLYCELYLPLFISLNRTEIPKVAPNAPWELRLLWLHCLH